jgi:lambda family phage tail tape measure protein
VATEGKAKIVITGEDRTGRAFDQAKRNIANLRSSVDGLAVPFAHIGAIVTGIGAGIAALSIKNVIDTADQLGKLSQRTGVSVEGLSALRYAGELADVSLDQLSDGLKRLNQTIAQAASGSKEDVATFSAMGVSFKNLDGSVRKADDVLADIADRFSGYADGPNKVELANKLAGKSFEAWIPLLNQGRKGLEDARSELEKFGGVMSGDLAKRSEEFNDNLTKMAFAAEALKVQLTSGLVGGLADLSTEFAEAARNGSTFELVLSKIKDVFSGRATSRLTGIDPLGLNSGDFEVSVKAAENAVDRIRKLRDEAAKATGADSSAALLRSQLPALEKQLADAERRVQALRVGGGRGFVNPELPTLKPEAPKPDAPSVKKPEANKELDRARKAYDDLIASINSRITIANEEIATGQKVSESQKFALDVVGKLAASEVKLSAAQKQGVTAALEKFLAVDKANVAQKELLEAQQKTGDIARKQLDTLFEEIDARAQANESMRQHVAEIGLNEKQLEALQQARIDDRIAIEEQSLAMLRNAEASAIEIAGRESAIRLLEEEVRLRREASKKQEAISADPVRGAQTAVDEYLEHVRQAGDATKFAVSGAIGGLEDALVSFAATGKADVKSLVNFIISEFLRIQVIRPMLADLFKSEGSGGGGGGLLSSFFSMFAGGRANGGPIPAGKFALVGEEGPELAFGPQTIVPLDRMGGGGTTYVYSPTVQAGVTRGELFSALQLTRDAMRGEMAQMFRRAGLA